MLRLIAVRLEVGGYFTQGWFANTSRAWRLALDTINQDLCWACRGVCESFGTIVSLQLKTEPAPPVITNWDYDFLQSNHRLSEGNGPHFRSSEFCLH